MFKVVCLIVLAQCWVLVSAGITCDPDIPSRPMLPDGANISTPNCTAGQFWNNSKCDSCPEGYFRTKKMAGLPLQYACRMCLAVNDTKHEVMKEKCNKTRDTDILCKPGYFRERNSTNLCNSTCKACDLCGTGENLGLNYAIRVCFGYDNVLCCKHADDVIINGQCASKSEVKGDGNSSDVLIGSLFCTFMSLIFLLTCHIVQK
ncbi:tumor necrosis factor receptor superfamily member 10C-like [Physella acuta]|uniref:tumor necrosis factor receptor superfamily member 10C-like n=1 Tax=Physella acuta TaxID=109671 RepID=UPI0027DAB6A6|nr:tumor necrosis factor receptor superfamily member 10C-like [Physella acuta]XP_059169793.1 tumor necrosis factor receptor superfamily member 10C-like [Physella acuta]